MNIAIIGTGNVGGALATKWAAKGHTISLGVRDLQNFKGKALLKHSNITAMPIAEAVAKSAVILIATPATAAVEVARSLGNTQGKIIIDTMNIVMGRGPKGFSNTSAALLANTAATDVVKCFNTTGYNNIKDPRYGGTALDAFVAGDSKEGKEAAISLAGDAGFAACYDIGGNDKFDLMEQFAFFWINLAMMQGHGREIGFKLLKR
ncbi:NAD(P)-binding domain-containing protein [Phaeodactylibacter sp.]|uniref:NADPH-dependent F420 reductase n=1 Tax=Phaeodactylibacter sp. TaxID=1940289 RepID=UPI0025F7C4B4|nr:NAD(P)-binding domain-containing protein [Phaeodactylibacter sp.]MCI4650904.1 NAD(P)-binding domain-containing protein [Phaeodactylibacter sp.]MCI5089861.1 NAD(P)-binding domain-containing protein [Phaeodactylibacter sp.]